MFKKPTYTDASDWGCDMHGRDLARRNGVTRRGFLRNGALALVGTSVVPSFLMRSIYAEMQTATANRKKLVVIFQRGACDGLNVVVPYAEKNYYAMRPTIAVKQNEVLDLNGFFGLHPAMAPFKPLYEQGQLAIVHAAGSPDTTRSHFDAQDYMESGTPDLKITPGRLAQPRPAGCRAAETSKPSPFRAVALGTQVPRTLRRQGARGSASPTWLTSPWPAKGKETSPISNAFQAMYDESTDSMLHGTGQETFEAVKMLKSADPAKYKPAAGINYPNRRRLATAMKQIAQLLKANLGVEAAFADIGGWDTHQNQGSATGQLAEPSQGVLRDPSRPSGPTWATTRKTSPWSRMSRVRSHRSAERHRRHGSRPRQCHVRPGRQLSRAARSTASGPASLMSS